MELKQVMRFEGNGINGLRDLCFTIDEKIGGKITIVEIGSFMGESAVIFAEEFPNAKIYCIDPWKSGYDDKDDANSSKKNQIEDKKISEDDSSCKDENGISDQS